ncbi:MAG TPA: cation-translocating P-type ATPase [Verrucomicrobiae bacterium]|jgi:Cd2+/Zn2+-exporting ATPase|nr:cation-translocating P-type ATPase [Verrucomicrobiae bacterium]
MSQTSASPIQSVPDNSDCLARSVVDVLSKEPSLEAVTINRTEQKISVATLGKTDEPRLNETVTGRIQRAYEKGVAAHCQLLEGKGDCHTCDTPLSESERQRITIQHQGDVTTIARVTCPTAPKFWRWRDLPFPKVVPRDVEFLEEPDHLDEHINEWKAQLAAAIFCGVCGLTGYLLHRANLQTASLIGFIAAYISGAWFTVEEVWERLQKRAIDVHFLMLAVAAGAACINAWAEGATLLFLFSFSGALEHFALGRTQKEIRSLFREAPKFATVLEDGREREVKVEQLRAGARLLVKPGSQFPVDAEVAKGKTAADESNLTGEAVPVEKAVGDTVLAGTINLWGVVEAVVLRPAAESSLQKIIRLIREAQHQKAPAQRFTDQFGCYYTYFVLVLSLAMFFVWWLGFHLAPFAVARGELESHSAFYRTMTLLVVASPCALVLSIPSAVLAAIAWSARHGILFRGGAAVEKLADVDTVALDKTGTLTTGELKVEAIESFPPGSEKEIARIAYSLEKLSTHPLARAITRYGKQQALEPIELEQFESVTGQGLRASRDGAVCLLGRRDWIAEQTGAAVWNPALKRLEGISSDRLKAELQTERGISEIWVAERDLLGRILLRDDVRPQARQVVNELRDEGLQTVVLTGDRKAAAEHMRAELQLDDVRAELKPENKVAEIRALTKAGRKVAMVGDGVNDAPSLAVAHIGVAMGARGSDAALEQADVVLMHDRLENFLAAFRLSQRARAVIRQNLVISLGTVVVLVTFAMLGKIPLTIGVVGHEGSTVVVVMNSLRLLFGKIGAPVEASFGQPAQGERK